jgi:hypothetical protein
VLVAVNTNPDSATTAWVTIDNDLHAAGETMACLYSTDNTQVGGKLSVQSKNGKSVQAMVPAGGFVIYK